MTTTYQFWAAGPGQKPTAVIHCEDAVVLEKGRMSGAQLEREKNTIMGWMPARCPNGVCEFTGRNEDDHSFLHNRLFLDDNGEPFIFQEPIGERWHHFLKSVMRDLKLRLAPLADSVHMKLVSEAPSDMTIEGWRIKTWEVVPDPDFDPTSNALVWDRIIWEKDDTLIETGHSWRPYDLDEL